MRIGTRPIENDNAPYVIAELGVNHDGSPQRALELTRKAREAGAEAIKLQLFDADLLMSKASKLASYQRAAGEQDPVAMLRRLQLSLDDMVPVVRLAHELGMHAIVTVFSADLVAEAQRLDWDAYKTASPDITNKPLLDALVATGRPIIVSTGASTLQEVGRALTWMREARERLAVLQCVSSYPTPQEHAELGGIEALQDIFNGPVGYSDHTTLETTGAVAVIAGACVLEKHFTDDKRAAGPDHAASLTAPELRRYRAFARISQRYRTDPASRPYLDTFLSLEVEQQVHGLVKRMTWDQREVPKVKRVLAIEEDVRTLSRQSVVTRRALPQGHTLSLADLTIKRPGTGIPPYELAMLPGRRLARAVEGDVPLTPDDVLPA
jgi:sialic acid synthase SpsE